jgi:hypothetical protein
MHGTTLKITSEYFVVASAAYNTKHVISCSKFIHILDKNSFRTTQTINRDSTIITCHTVPKEIIVVCSTVQRETEEVILYI